jgi:Family of unknown function (DUF6636)
VETPSCWFCRVGRVLVRGLARPSRPYDPGSGKHSRVAVPRPVAARRWLGRACPTSHRRRSTRRGIATPAAPACGNVPWACAGRGWSRQRRVGRMPGTMVRIVTLVVAFAFVAGAATAAAADRVVQISGALPTLGGSGFRTPSGNIACEVDEHAAFGPFRGRRTLSCVVFSASTARGQRTWSMRPTGTPRVAWIAANIATDVPSLAYGRRWRFEGFRCRSRRVGLTCSNRSGHGFFLCRQSQRIF